MSDSPDTEQLPGYYYLLCKKNRKEVLTEEEQACWQVYEESRIHLDECHDKAKERTPIPRFMSRQPYYDRSGLPITLGLWSLLGYDMSYKVVKQEVINGWFVSTVWIGLDSRVLGELPPMIFETMIFKEDKNLPDVKEFEDYMVRYPTEEDALYGHLETVKLVKERTFCEKNEAT